MIPYDKRLGPLDDVSNEILTDGGKIMRVNEPAIIKNPPLNHQTLHWGLKFKNQI
jgi:hypothetical protein